MLIARREWSPYGIIRSTAGVVGPPPTPLVCDRTNRSHWASAEHQCRGSSPSFCRRSLGAAETVLDSLVRVGTAASSCTVRLGLHERGK